MGCRETEALLLVEDDQTGDQRVLCPVHVDGWILPPGGPG